MIGGNLLTNTRMSCAKTCLKKHYLCYELGIRRDRQSQPLRIGTAFHVGLDMRAKGHEPHDILAAIAKQYADLPPWCIDSESIRDWHIERETVVRLLHAYFWLYQSDQLEIVSSERQFGIDIRNPDTGASARIFRLAGKIDKIVRLPDGRLAIYEHKTTSDSLAVDSDYWPRLAIDNQISLYVYAARRLGYPIELILYDVVKKPDIEPKKITQTATSQFFATRMYCGESFAVACENGHEWYVNGERLEVDHSGRRPAIRETVAMWGARLTSDIVQRPQHYFARREIPRLESDIREFESELWHTQKLLRECQRNGHWFRNTSACLHPYKCEYTTICFQRIDPTGELPAGYIRVENIHTELELTDGHNNIASAVATCTAPAGAATDSDSATEPTGGTYAAAS